jgi:hypothetical protein
MTAEKEALETASRALFGAAKELRAREFSMFAPDVG